MKSNGNTIEIGGTTYRVCTYTYSCITPEACERIDDFFSGDLPAAACGKDWGRVAKAAGFHPCDTEVGASVAEEGGEILGLTVPAGTIHVSEQMADGCEFALLVPVRFRVRYSYWPSARAEAHRTDRCTGERWFKTYRAAARFLEYGDRRCTKSSVGPFGDVEEVEVDALRG